LAWIDRLYGETGIYDHIVVNSGTAEARYRQRSKRYVRRLVRIDHGLHISATLPDKQGARDLFHLPPNSHVLVTTGRLVRGKNQDVLIRALQHLPHVHLALAGAGPERSALECLAATLEVEDRVHFVGELEAGDIPAFLAAGDLFLFASSYETFGMSVVEAALAGVPVIAGDIPVLREVLSSDDGNCPALFFPLGDDRALADSVTRVLASPQLANGLAETGRRLARRYSVDRMIDAYEDLIRDRGGR
jgi:glycosyltransferase involved in cell wall biosynthesis